MPQNKNTIDRGSLQLVLQELKENPLHKLNIAFALMSIIPFLVFFYILVVKLSTIDILVGNIGAVLFITIFISLFGLYLGYTILKHVLDRTIKYAAQAKHSDQLKSTFVATVSHELKNPIAVIQLNLYNISKGLVGTVSDDLKAIIELCCTVTERMHSLVSELLDLHKIEAGMVAEQRKLYNIVALLERQTREFESLFGDKKIKLTRQFPQQDLSVWGYEDKIMLAVNNLLSNALKYTPQGGEVALSAFPSEGLARLECSDTGPGIPADKLEKVFDKFERLDTTKEGTGLGLAITKDIVELHKGKIWVESPLEKGSTFIVLLPRDLRQARLTSVGQGRR